MDFDKEQGLHQNVHGKEMHPVELATKIMSTDLPNKMVEFFEENGVCPTCACQVMAVMIGFLHVADKKSPASRDDAVLMAAGGALSAAAQLANGQRDNPMYEAMSPEAKAIADSLIERSRTGSKLN